MSKAAKMAEAKPRPDPDKREKAAMDRALERYNERPEAVRFKASTSPEGLVQLTPPHSDDGGSVLHALDTFGTASVDFQSRALSQLGSVLRTEGEHTINEGELNAGLAAVAGIAPQDEIEAMLAVQMVTTHDLAMKTMRKLNHTSDPDRMDRFCTIATKMLRTYTTQVEALAKLRRGGAQTVRVEHVHVYHGGQAIVGNVQGGTPPRGMIENGSQPYALAGPAAHAIPAGTSMLCANPQGAGMPVTSGLGEATVPDARRRQGKRGAGR